MVSKEIAEAAERSDVQRLQALGNGDLLLDMENDGWHVKRVWFVDDLKPDLLLIWSRATTRTLSSLRKTLAVSKPVDAVAM